MNCFRCTSLLSTAILLSLSAVSAQAATRSDLQKRDVNQLRQQYQSLTATRGIAGTVHARHEQFMLSLIHI